LSVDIDLDPQAAARSLGSRSVGILGLAGHGSLLAVSLARCGLGHLVLADPYPLRAAETGSGAASNTWLAGQPRHDAVVAAVRAELPSISVGTVGQNSLKLQDLDKLVDDCELIVGCYDPEFRAAHYQLNRTCLGAGKAALYSELGPDYAWIGPLVIPAQTPCYTCFRLRRLACSPNYERAVTEERDLGQRQAPRSDAPSFDPELLASAAQLLCAAIVSHFSSSGERGLRGRILSFDPATKSATPHTILAAPVCPECQQGARGPAPPEPLEFSKQQLGAASQPNILCDLVSPFTGIIRRCDSLPSQGEPSFGVSFCLAELANHRHSKQPTSDLKCGFGKGIGPKQALDSAIGEALEIYSGSLPSYRDIVYARRGDLDDPALDPRDLVLYRDDQYRSLPYVPYSDEATLGWVWARALGSSEPIRVPALAVYLDYNVRSSQELLFPLSSNGLATGRSLAEVLLLALYELLERDAFVITWLNELPVRSFDPNSHPNRDVRDICNRMKEHGLDVHLLKLQTDQNCSVVMAMARNRSNAAPATTIGLGSDWDAGPATEKAVVELAQAHSRTTRDLRQEVNRARMRELCDNPNLVSSMLDHALLYASPSATHAFDFLLQPEREPFEQVGSAAPPVEVRLAQLLNDLFSKGFEVYYADLTAREVSTLGLRSVRVIVPHLQPIHFGRAQRRLGGTRLFELPVELGLTNAPRTVSALNDSPHPLG
jgi:ribosomal protein S12 methylthiotransferase accessory factor